jgi:hypothetical protein
MNKIITIKLSVLWNTQIQHIITAYTKIENKIIYLTTKLKLILGNQKHNDSTWEI